MEKQQITSPGRPPTGNEMQKKQARDSPGMVCHNKIQSNQAEVLKQNRMVDGTTRWPNGESHMMTDLSLASTKNVELISKCPTPGNYFDSI